MVALARPGEPGEVEIKITPALALGDPVAGIQYRLGDELITVAGGADDTLLLTVPLAAHHDTGSTLVPAVDAFAEGSDPFAGGISDVKAARVTLVEAQILALGDGVEIVPPVAGKILFPFAASAVSDITGLGYTASGALQVVADMNVLAYLAATNLSLLAASPAFVVFKPVAAAIAETPPPTGLNLAALADEGSPVLGEQEGSGGTIEVIVLYVEIDAA